MIQRTRSTRDRLAGVPSDAEIARMCSELRGLMRRRGLDEHSAEDLVQEGWLRTLRREEAGTENLRGWMSVVCTRLLSEFRRGERHRRQREEAAARPAGVVVEEPDGSFLRAKVSELPEPYRSVVALRYLEEHSPAEIALLLERPAATVRTQLKRGLELLRERIPDEQRARRSLVDGLLGLVLPWRWRRRGRGGGAPAGPSLVAAACAVVLVSATALLLAVQRSPDSRVALAAEAVEGPADEALAAASVNEAEPAERVALAARPAAALRAYDGVVLDADGAPVGGAAVRHGPSHDPAAAVVVRADALGRFRLEGVPFDELVWATQEGRLDSNAVYAAALAHEKVLELVLPRVARRAVLVVDEEGVPVPGARVRLGRVEPDPLQLVAGSLQLHTPYPELVTDARGRCELALPAGAERLELRVHAAGHPPARVMLQPEEARTDPHPIEVALDPAAGVRGRVRGPDGLPLAARVEVLPEDGDAVALAAAADGTFSVEGLPRGRFEVRAWDPASDASIHLAGRLDAGEIRDLVLLLGDRNTVRGRVVRDGRPIAARVELAMSGRRFADVRAVDTDADGSFVFRACASRGHVVTAFTPDGSAPLGWTSTRPGEEVVLEAAEAPPGTTSLEVRFGTGQGALPTLVEVRRLDVRRSFVAPVDPDTGTAVVVGLPAVPHEVWAWIPERGLWMAGTAVGREGFERLECTVPPPGRLVVEVPRAGRAAEPVQVWVHAPCVNTFGFEKEGRNRLRRVLAERDGVFEEELLPGQYLLSVVVGEGYNTIRPVEVRSGEVQRLRIDPREGVDVLVDVSLPRALLPGEEIALDARNGDGRVTLLGRWLPGRPVRVPHDSVEVGARTTRGLRGQVPLAASGDGPATRLGIALRESD